MANTNFYFTIFDLPSFYSGSLGTISPRRLEPKTVHCSRSTTDGSSMMEKVVNSRKVNHIDHFSFYTDIYRNCWTIPRTGLYRAKGQNRPFLVLEPYTPRTRYLQHSSKYRCDTAVTNANGVLVRLISDGSGPGYIRLCLVLL